MVLDGRNISGLRRRVHRRGGAGAAAGRPHVYIARNANPMGDGMEWVAVVPALFIAGLFAAPALHLEHHQPGAHRRRAVGDRRGAGQSRLLTEIAREFSHAG